MEITRRRSRGRLTGLFAVAGLALVALSPALREALTVLEPVVPPLLFWTALGFSAARLFYRRRGDVAARRSLRRFERRVSRGLGRWGWAPAALLFMLPLWSQWALRPPGAAAALAAFLGRLPWSDATGHFEGSNRLLAEGQLNGFSERRPLAASFMSAELAATGGALPAALSLQCALCGIAAFLAARALALRFGLPVALGFFAVFLGLMRDFLGAVVTEPLSGALACLALAVLATRPARRSLATLVAGFLCLDAALRTRPGAQMLLPSLWAWAAFVQRGRRARTLAALVAVAALGAVHTSALNHLYGTGEASATSYAAFTFYGLTRNANYEVAYRDFSDELARQPEGEVARLVYRKALERLWAQPGDFLRALARNAASLHKLALNLARAVSPRSLFDLPDRLIRPAPVDLGVDRLLGGLPLVLAALGLALQLRRAPAEQRLLWLAVAVGVSASAAFVLGDSATRVLVAAFPWIAFGIARGLDLRRPLGASRESSARERMLVRVASGLGLAVLLVALAGPAVAHRIATRPDPRLLASLHPPASSVCYPPTCPSVLVSRPEDEPAEGPSIDRGQLMRWLALAGAADTSLATLRPPYALLSCYDFLGRRQRLLIAPPEFARAKGFVQLSAAPPTEGGAFEHVEAWQPLAPDGAGRDDRLSGRDGTPPSTAAHTAKPIP